MQSVPSSPELGVEREEEMGGGSLSTSFHTLAGLLPSCHPFPLSLTWSGGLSPSRSSSISSDVPLVDAQKKKSTERMEQFLPTPSEALSYLKDEEVAAQKVSDLPRVT